MRWYSILLAIFLSGCATLPPASRQAIIASTAFTLNGRISTSHRGERNSAGLHWTHLAQSDDILLLAPLGQTAAHVYRDAQLATLDSGNQHYQAVDVESLMQQVLNWHLPLNGLHHWVLGMADAVRPAMVERDAQGRIEVMYQDGWEIRYLRYADDNPDSLPARLQLSREGLQVQLLIDEWEWIP